MNAPVDFVIIAPLTEELNALLSKFGNAQRVAPYPESSHVYYSICWPVRLPGSSDYEYKVILTQPTGMGRVAAANITGEAVRRWQPRFVLVTGIAGGLANAGVSLGDILIPDQIADFENQKLSPKKTHIRWKVFNTDTSLYNAAKQMRSEQWASLIDTQRPKRGFSKVHTGTICTGDKVIANNWIGNFTKVWSQLIGVEMEAGGVASAALHARPTPGFFMIRGVSDFADQHKNQPRINRWRSYACDAAAAYTIGLLNSGPVSPLITSEIPNSKISKGLGHGPAKLPVSLSPPLRHFPKRSHQEIRMAISRALSLLANDRFGTDHGPERKGGWALSYSNEFLPLAFPDAIPGTCSPTDSITVTQWVVRGLHCLRELEARTKCLTSEDSRLLTDLLTDAKAYLIRHCRDGMAGMIRVSSQAELKIIPDVRHSAAMAKALLCYPGADRQLVSALLQFVFKHASSNDRYELRLSTHSEILAALDLLDRNPALRALRGRAGFIDRVRRRHEAELLTLYKPTTVVARKETGISKSPTGLFCDPAAASHMGPYYTWWALDCYGARLKHSKSKKVNALFSSAIAGVKAFESRINKGESAFPLISTGTPNPGATAQIAEIFSRYLWQEESQLVTRCLRYVVGSLCNRGERVVPFPFTLWAFFCLLRQCYERRLIKM